MQIQKLSDVLHISLDYLYYYKLWFTQTSCKVSTLSPGNYNDSFVYIDNLIFNISSNYSYKQLAGNNDLKRSFFMNPLIKIILRKGSERTNQ